MSVKVIMLTSGLEIVSEVLDGLLNDTTLVLKSPSIIMQQPDATGTKVSIGLAPFAPYTEKSTAIELARVAVACIMDPTDALKNEYNRLFGSGIIVQKNQLIT
jgi:hypothetical protein